MGFLQKWRCECRGPGLLQRAFFRAALLRSDRYLHLTEQISHSGECLASFGGVSDLSFQHYIKRSDVRRALAGWAEKR